MPSSSPLFARSSSSRQSSEKRPAPKVWPFDFSVCAARRSPSVSPCSCVVRSVATRAGASLEERVDHLRQELLPAELSQALERARVEAGAGALRARCAGAFERTRAAQRLRQLVRTDRLGDVVIHPGGEAGLAVLGHRVRRHRDDARASLRRPALADPARSIETVQLGHLHVHEHDVVGLPLERLQCLEAVRRHVGAVAELVEEPECDLLVHGVVLGQEDPQRRCRRLAHFRHGLAGLRLLYVLGKRFHEGVVELRGLDRLRQLHRELSG